MAWGDPSDYWWLKPVQPAQVSPAMQFGAQLKQQAINNALKQKDLELENQRTGIQIQEYFSKKELQNKALEGTAVLAQSMARFTDPTDPTIPETIYGVLSKNPMLAPIAEQFLDNHRQALQFKQRQEELAELRLSREQTAAAALAERIAKREGLEASTARKLDQLGEHYENQDEVARMKAELAQIVQETSIRDTTERRRLFEMELDRRVAADQFRREQFDAKQKLMTPEQRMRYQEKKKALRDESVLGKVLDLKTGKRTAEEYQRRDKAIEDEFFGGKAMPLNTNLKNPITKDEYDKLPVGAEYVAPDGSTRVKK